MMNKRVRAMFAWARLKSTLLLNKLLNKPRNRKNYLETADHRYEFITTLAEDVVGPGGVLHKAGAIVELSAKAKLSSGKMLTFPMPSMVSIYLNMSNEAYENGKKLVAGFKYGSFKYNENDVYLENGLFKNKVEVLFDLFEQRAIAIVFAFTALEAFANEVIPESYKYQTTTRGVTATLDKQQIERTVSLDEKLKQILPAIRGVDSPASLASIWNTYKQLKKERDMLIHLKHHNRFGGMHTPKNEAIWNALVGDDYPNYAITLRPMFEHFYPDPSERKRWMKRVPYWL